MQQSGPGLPPPTPHPSLPHFMVLVLSGTDKLKHPCTLSWIEKHTPGRGWTIEYTSDRSAAFGSIHDRGGVVVDLVRFPELYCIEPLDPIVDTLHHGFISGNAQELFEGVVGFCAGNPLAAAAGENSSPLDLVRFRHMVHVLPPYTFRPEIALDSTRSQLYLGHARVYASVRPDTSLPPNRWVSLLICSLDTPPGHLRPCLESILHQTGEFGIEVVWINDGSSPHHTKLLTQELENLEHFSRRLRVSYHQNDRNLGVAGSLRRGLALCSHDIVFRMDADDVMEVHRMRTQLQYMDSNPRTMLCGGQMQIFAEGPGQSDKQNRRTSHPSWSAETYAMRSSTPAWIVNHPTVCFRRDPILAVGGYRNEYNGVEDLDLVLRVMMHYGHFHNLGTVLVRHRRHRSQVTHRIEKDVAKSQRRARMQQQLIENFKKNYIQARKNR